MECELFSEFAIVGATVTAESDRDKAPQSKRGIVPQSGESNALLTIDDDRYKSGRAYSMLRAACHGTREQTGRDYCVGLRGNFR